MDICVHLLHNSLVSELLKEKPGFVLQHEFAPKHKSCVLNDKEVTMGTFENAGSGEFAK